MRSCSARAADRTRDRDRPGARGSAGGARLPVGGAARAGRGRDRGAARRSSPTRPTSIGCGRSPARSRPRSGPVEILVLNTGGPPLGRRSDNAVEEWETAYRSLVLAPRLLIEAALPGMRERGWGRIVNVASSSIREPIPGLTLSNANRMAAVGLLNTLAREVAGDGITVNTIATGRFATTRLAELRLARDGRGGRGSERGSGRAARAAGGVRRPGRVRLLRAGRLPDRRRDPARRRAAALGLASGRAGCAKGIGSPSGARARRGR